jgi:hypothetical protein
MPAKPATQAQEKGDLKFITSNSQAKEAAGGGKKGKLFFRYDNPLLVATTSNSQTNEAANNSSPRLPL